jgi:hypothetical protein
LRYLCAALLVIYTSPVSAQSQHAEFFEVVELASPFPGAIASSRGEIQILMDSGAGVGGGLDVEGGELMWTDGYGYADQNHILGWMTFTGSQRWVGHIGS